MVEFLKKLDHPLLFLFFLILATTGLKSFLAWGASELGLPGAASFLRH
jgi:hypothetical protein